MKAHVGLSGPVKKEFIREWNEQSISMTRKMFKIFAWVMHEEGYGAYRINRFDPEDYDKEEKWNLEN